MKVSCFLLLSILLIGCAPSYNGWEGGRDFIIGKKMNELSNKPGALWSPASDIHSFDYVVIEGSDYRYYLTWIRTCKYSILVSLDGVVKSWRYETSDKHDCYVF